MTHSFPLMVAITPDRVRWLWVASLLLLTACSTTQQSQEKITTVEPVAEQKQTPVCASIAAVGDIMLGGSAASYMQPDFSYAFAATKTYLQQADITVANLETALTEKDNDWVDKKYRFRNPPVMADSLADAGFDLVSLANNHSMDYGPEGLFDTLAALKAAGLKGHGAGATLAEARKPVILETEKGLRLAFLAYSNTFPEIFWATDDTPGTAFGRVMDVVADVKKAREQADIVVVSFHWGRETTKELRDYQPLLAHAAIDAGASLVLGHHPHILQGIERYKDGLVLYSLGNFAFGSFSKTARTSMLAEVTVCDGREVGFQLLPLNVNNLEVYFQPQVAEADLAQLILQELQAMSEPLGMQLQWQGEAIVEALPEESESRSAFRVE